MLASHDESSGSQEAQNCDISPADKPLRPAEQSAARDAHLYRALVVCLDGDTHWRGCVDETRRLLREAHVREGKMADRRVARRIAIGLKTHIAPYARNNRPGQQMFMAMLLRAASVHPNVAYQAMLGLGSVSVWTDSGPQAGDSKRAFRPEWVQAADRGLRIVVRRGAGHCVRCGAKLREVRSVNGPAGRRVWQDYCGPCDADLGEWCPGCLDNLPDHVCVGRRVRDTTDQRAVKLVLDSASGIALRDEGSRVRARRIKRSGVTPVITLREPMGGV
jgi:hypothetical protein